MAHSSFSFRKPWRDFASGEAEAFMNEVRIELTPGHPLHGVNLTAMARSDSTDDVLFRLDDGTLAEVHLTWRGSSEQLPWPRHRLYASIEEWVQQVMIPASEGS
jgi:hypothetical protein